MKTLKAYGKGSQTLLDAEAMWWQGDQVNFLSRFKLEAGDNLVTGHRTDGTAYGYTVKEVIDSKDVKDRYIGINCDQGYYVETIAEYATFDSPEYYDELPI